MLWSQQINSSTTTYSVVANQDVVYVSNDLTVSKYDTNGNLLWSKTSTYTDPSKVGIPGDLNVLTIDKNGGIIAVGTTATGLNGYPVPASMTQAQVLLLNYDSNGNLLWSNQTILQFGAQNGAGWGVQTDAAGNIYISGINGSPPLEGYFINKYTSSGNLVWSQGNPEQSFSGLSGVYAGSTALAVDSNGNSFITGFTNQSLNGEQHIGPYQSENYFIAKYNTAGVLQWTKLSASQTIGYSGAGICLSPNNTINVVGSLSSAYSAQYTAYFIDQWAQ